MIDAYEVLYGYGQKNNGNGVWYYDSKGSASPGNLTNEKLMFGSSLTANFTIDDPLSGVVTAASSSELLRQALA